MSGASVGSDGPGRRPYSCAVHGVTVFECFDRYSIVTAVPLAVTISMPSRITS